MVFEMMRARACVCVCMWNIYGIRRNDRVRNPLIRERCCCQMNVVNRAERNVLKVSRGYGENGKRKPNQMCEMSKRERQ